MNLLLLEENEINPQGQVLLTDRRFEHLKRVHKAAVGDQLKVGVLNGLMGLAEVIELNTKAARLEISLSDPPPPALPLTLILALPRPRMLARSLEHLSSLGVKSIHLLHTARVEKSYWQSPELQKEKIHQHLILGLEQARDTQLPEVHQHHRFKPFVEDQLPYLSQATKKLVAHPGPYPECPRGLKQTTTLAIGPEGGFVDFEIEALQKQGFEAVQLGPRILRVETAVTALIARIF